MSAPAFFAVMGIVNVTPDSFSDGGLYLDPNAAIAHAAELREQGADLLDIGGESTRPGAEPVSAEEELARVLPVVQGLRDRLIDLPISIDTTKAAVAGPAIEAGASLVNDVTALRGDPAMAALVAEWEVDVCLMHMQGEPRTMQDAPHYEDVVSEVKAFLEQRMEAAIAAGIHEDRILLDPGIGFGKSLAHNLQLLRRLDEIVALGRPVLVGPSRKQFLGAIAGGREVDERLPGTIAACIVALERGATIFRVHDVAPVRDSLLLAAATVSRP